MQGRVTHFITESLLTRWIEESERERERARADEPDAHLPVTRLCHPLRDMLAINSGGEIVGTGLRISGARAGGGGNVGAV